MTGGRFLSSASWRATNRYEHRVKFHVVSNVAVTVFEGMQAKMETAALGGLCRAVVVTALPVEFSAVCEHLEGRKEDTHPQGTVYERGLFRPGVGREWEVVVVEIGAGNPAAAAEVERAITYCRPNVVLFVGVAGGLKDVAIGDVVAASKVYSYEFGKESAGFKPRPASHDSNYRLTPRQSGSQERELAPTYCWSRARFSPSGAGGSNSCRRKSCCR
jgi:nucleoside phosphorylase